MASRVIKILGVEDRSWYDKDDVMKLLGVKQSKAYSIIRGARKRAIAAHDLPEDYPAGKMPKRLLEPYL